MKNLASLLIALTLAGVSSLAAAQTQAGKIGVRAQPPAPPAPTPIAAPVLPGAPSASGLASPFPPSVPTIAVPGTSAAGTAAPGSPPTGDLAGLAPDTSVMGAGAYGTRGLTRTSAPGPVTDVDIARSFLMADGNRDGELSRAEAMRLSLMPLAFEEMDANHDDILTRSEYEAAVR
jgi:hypothetical protein